MIQASRVEFELEDKDVREDLGKVINAMSSIRNEAVKNQVVSPQQLDEYLNLSYRLASTIEALSPPEVIKRMQFLVENADKDQRLLEYDYLQENYWNKHNPQFTQTLDEVVIASLRDNFDNPESKAHVWQAVKILGVKGSDFDEKEKVYDTVKPFNGKVKGFRKESKLGRLLRKLTGYSYKIEADAELKLRGFSPLTVRNYTFFIDKFLDAFIYAFVMSAQKHEMIEF